MVWPNQTERRTCHATLRLYYYGMLVQIFHNPNLLLLIVFATQQQAGRGYSHGIVIDGL
jgi:hypothetical protein